MLGRTKDGDVAGRKSALSPMNLRKGVNSCVVVGAGIAGLIAGHTLRRHRIRASIVDKGRGVGGRLATRRMGGGVFDHGAQFFTFKNRNFESYLREWLAAGVVQEWGRGFVNADTGAQDGHPRYRGAEGMTGIAKYLARDLDIRRDERVREVRIRGGMWEALFQNGGRVRAESLILTPPLPQSLELIDAGNVVLPRSARQKLEGVSYDPCIAVLVLLEGPTQVPKPGGLRLSGNPIAWIADNRQKGISPDAWGVTIHAGPDFSRRHWEMEDEAVGRLVLNAADEWLGSRVQSVQVHRWRYSEPVSVIQESCLFVPISCPVVFAGDGFGRSRVEGAALSGLAAASWLVSSAE